MSFMDAEITDHRTWVEYTADDGSTALIPDEYFDRLGAGIEGEDFFRKEGYGARLSADGYLDCTDWCVFDTISEAAEYLLDTFYDLDPIDGEDKATIAELEKLSAGAE